MAKNEGNAPTGEFTLHRSFTLASVMGHTVVFKKGEPVYVPPVLRAEAQAIGAIPVDEPEELDEGAEPPIPVGVDRQEQVVAGILAIRGRNQREDFTAGGAPTVRALSKEVGFEVNGKEVTACMEVIAQQAAAEADANAVGGDNE